MKSKKMARISVIITAAMLFLYLTSLLLNNWVFNYFEIPVYIRIPSYIFLQTAIIVSAVLTIIGAAADGRKLPIAMSVLTIVATLIWEFVRFPLNLVSNSLTKEIALEIPRDDGTFGELLMTRSYLNLAVSFCNFLFMICITILFVILFFRAKDRAAAIRSEFAKLSTGVVIAVSCCFSVVASIINMIVSRLGEEATANAAIAMKTASPVLSVVVALALLVVALLLGIICKKEPANEEINID